MNDTESTGDEWKGEPASDSTEIDLNAERRQKRGWLFTPGASFRITEEAEGKRRRTASPLRPNWLRLFDGAAKNHPCIPPHVWVRTRVSDAHGFWVDTTCASPEFVRDNEVADIRVADPPEQFRYESAEGDAAGSWDDDIA